MSKTRYLDKAERKEFENEYRNVINERIILRMKKKTGKGTDRHICLNPRKLQYLIEKLGVTDNDKT